MDYLQMNKAESKESPKYNQQEAVNYNKRQKYSATEWKSVQASLNKNVPGSNLTVDGIPGKNTADSIYTFQSLKPGLSVDGKFGPNTLNVLKPWNSTKTGESASQSQSGGNVKIPSGSTIMSKSYTPDLDLLNRHATQEGFNVRNVDQSANYVAKYCTGSNSQHQCTRGTSLFLQLASYARGEANKKYVSSCAAHLFGSANSLTNYNISSSVAGEYSIKSADNKTGKANMNSYITNNLKKDGEFVTFKYSNSQHIVFYSSGQWYSDFKQGTAAGCGGNNTLYSNVHFFTR